ncbi:cobalamin biosynthesis protein CobW [Bartonella tamiae]|uniref:Cobalamin biosynthesis protein CobW n=1 Tax=Bartonella tamiae Th239 TaxID=1094558 RepID=J1JVG4_9HYPH|nr:cobalamin biosynthesis protein CobW [Bartonella tamiae]EJF88932.1 cobalamin biosynthesis protein CobW [Bartonella tamiae Th239]EJF94818.1 cobalamin biosynthesis protein CobW [Bartonella tamiae Th307]
MSEQSFLSRKIPATVVTGFLGSGKTTMIRNLVQNAHGKKIALIINEFGDLGVDGGLFKGCGIENCQDEDIIELNNGCICCTVADDFIPTMIKLLDRKDKPDHIVIETSGLALPQPLVSAFNWPEIKTQVTVDGVITVVDSAAVAQGRFADDHDKITNQRKQDAALDHDSPLEELFKDQIHSADLIVLNKADLLDQATMSKVRDMVTAHSDRHIQMIPAQFGNLDLDVLLGLDVGSERDIDNRKSHHEMHHENGAPHSHDDFLSFVVNINVVSHINILEKKLKKLIEDYGILRLKGFLNVKGKPMRLVVQAVGQRVETYFDRPWQPNETRNGQIVVIGLHDINENAVRNTMEAMQI